MVSACFLYLPVRSPKLLGRICFWYMGGISLARLLLLCEQSLTAPRAMLRKGTKIEQGLLASQRELVGTSAPLEFARSPRGCTVGKAQCFLQRVDFVQEAAGELGVAVDTGKNLRLRCALALGGIPAAPDAAELVQVCLSVWLSTSMAWVCHRLIAAHPPSCAMLSESGHAASLRSRASTRATAGTENKNLWSPRLMGGLARGRVRSRDSRGIPKKRSRSRNTVKPGLTVLIIYNSTTGKIGF